MNNNLSTDERELITYISRYGGLLAPDAERHGWTVRGLPTAPLRALIARRIVAPRVLTSQPLRVVWQLRATWRSPETLTHLSSQLGRAGVREYAPGGLHLGNKQ